MPKESHKHSRPSSWSDLAAIEIQGGILLPEVVSKISAASYIDQSLESYDMKKGLDFQNEISRHYMLAQACWKDFESENDSDVNSSKCFVESILEKCLGFNTLEKIDGKQVRGRHYPINFAAENGRIPIVIVSSLSSDNKKESKIDVAQKKYGSESYQRTPTQLLQEYLNESESSLWGIVSDGLTLRILRGNRNIVRPSWIEVDLERIFTEGLYADFKTLWLTAHASRFGKYEMELTDCPIENWKERCRIDGAVAKEKLRLGVEAALCELGSGFIQHPDNNELRNIMSSGAISPQDFYEELLRLVYRLIFLFTAEDRNLIHSRETSQVSRRVYFEGYSVSRLRERCMRSTSLDKNIDAYEGVKSLFKSLLCGQDTLGLVALGGIFEEDLMPNLVLAKIENRKFLKAIWNISWFRSDEKQMNRINWRDMETEELGSVYESLLELTPIVDIYSRYFKFAERKKLKGSVRKESGSYYTPDSLVELVLNTALDPVLDEAESQNTKNPVSEILKLSIIDPSCGSGHFLLGASRRVADRIVKHRGQSQSREAFQHALREVVSNCIYGVDRNPLAVELCKVALWIEALEPGKPLSFLDSRIRCGDSLIGISDYSMLRSGIPDEAYKVISGDDTDISKSYKAANKSSRDGIAASGFIKSLSMPTEVIDYATHIASMPEDTLRQVRKKSDALRKYENSSDWKRLSDACNLYLSAFFSPKVDEKVDSSASIPITKDVWDVLKENKIPRHLINQSIAMATKVRALHWPLVFPLVMAKGGFDVVIGNPPWEVMELEEIKFFESKDPSISELPGEQRKKKIKELQVENPNLWEEYLGEKRLLEATKNFIRKSGRFVVSIDRKLNTYSIFIEHFSNIVKRKSNYLVPNSVAHETQDLPFVSNGVSRDGFVGIIVPTRFVTEISNARLFSSLVDNQRLRAVYDFENRRKIFPDVHLEFRFSIVAIGPGKKTDYRFLLHDVSMLDDYERKISLSPDEISNFSPNTKTVPIFRSRADKRLTSKLYSKAPVLVRKDIAAPNEKQSSWGFRFRQGYFNMTSTSKFFRTADQLEGMNFTRSEMDWEHSDGSRYVPLYEAKMVHIFDHRWSTFGKVGGELKPRKVSNEEKQKGNFEVTPRYWVPECEADIRSSQTPSRLKTEYVKENEEKCLSVLAEWIAGSTEGIDQNGIASSSDRVQKHISSVLRQRATSLVGPGSGFQKWLGTSVPRGIRMQHDFPLSNDDLAFIADHRGSNLEMVERIILSKRPRWMMVFHDITSSTSDRTAVSTILSRCGIADTLNICFTDAKFGARETAIFQGLFSSLVFDYIVRQKVSGLHLNESIIEQIPSIFLDSFSASERKFICDRVLELTYTSPSIKPWAEDLGYSGKIFNYCPDRRAELRADIDAIFAMKYGVSRDELKYILDPQSIGNSIYPSETFRILKEKEEKGHDKGGFGEYRTQRLVLGAFDRLTGGGNGR